MKKFSTWLLDVFFGKTAYPQVRGNRNKAHQEGFPQLHSDSYTTPDPSRAFFRNPKRKQQPESICDDAFCWVIFWVKARCQFFFCTLPKVERLEPEKMDLFPSSVQSPKFVGGNDFQVKHFVEKYNSAGGEVGYEVFRSPTMM